MIVYRIEKDGLGPYRHNDNEGWTDEDHNDVWHPLPHADGIPCSVIGRYDWFSGFTSIQAILDWFTEKELRNLDRIGFKLFEYSVHPSCVFEGRTQCVFYKSSNFTVHAIPSVLLLQGESHA